VGRLFCLFVCYGVQDSSGVMDGGGGSYIEDGLVEGMGEANIRRSMRKKEGRPRRCFGWQLLSSDYLAGC
jgi:hypothetical protein